MRQTFSHRIQSLVIGHRSSGIFLFSLMLIVTCRKRVSFVVTHWLGDGNGADVQSHFLALPFKFHPEHNTPGWWECLTISKRTISEWEKDNSSGMSRDDSITNNQNVIGTDNENTCQVCTCLPIESPIECRKFWGDQKRSKETRWRKKWGDVNIRSLWE